VDDERNDADRIRKCQRKALLTKKVAETLRIETCNLSLPQRLARALGIWGFGIHGSFLLHAVVMNCVTTDDDD